MWIKIYLTIFILKKSVWSFLASARNVWWSARLLDSILMMVPPEFCRYEKPEQLKFSFEICVLIQTNLRFLPFCCFTQQCNLKQSPGTATNTSHSGNTALARCRFLHLDECASLLPLPFIRHSVEVFSQNTTLPWFIFSFQMISTALLLLRKPLKVCFSPATIPTSSLSVELNCLSIGNRCKWKSSPHYQMKLKMLLETHSSLPLTSPSAKA